MFHNGVGVEMAPVEREREDRGSAGSAWNQLQRRVAPADTMIIGIKTPERPRD